MVTFAVMIYKNIIRPLLFSIDAEKVHHMVMNLLRIAPGIPGVTWIMEKCFLVRDSRLETTVAGLKFRNRVGLAAGFDKDAKAVRGLGALGFGFIEIGTVTPLAQPGNETPRLFRLPADKALINRMGFNNEGVDKAVERLQKNPGFIIGGNIGKNKVTANENATSDYLTCFHKLFPYCDYFVVNISSPNTPGLRELQDKEPLITLLQAIQEANRGKGKTKPVFLKIAPDLTETQVDDIIEITLQTGLAGLVISNTTISRAGLTTPQEEVVAIGAGGLSGAPVFERSTDLVAYVAKRAAKRFAIIASGGIFTAGDAIKKLEAGADLVQLYTGFIYEGPALIKAINKKLLTN